MLLNRVTGGSVPPLSRGHIVARDALSGSETGIGDFPKICVALSFRLAINL
jgi:hypothetical protein